MCIGISKPAELILDRSVYEMCFDGNPDGAGFATLQDGVITVHKGYFTFEEFYAAFQPLEHLSPMVHFRIATHGETNAFNCHPWLIQPFQWNDKVYSFAIIHNGILDYESSTAMSDTGHFVHDLLEPHLKRDPHFPYTPEGQFFLDRAISHGNKMVILRNDGQCAIIRSSAGEKDLGAWFSNTSYKVKKYIVPAHTGFMGWEQWQQHQLTNQTVTRTTFDQKSLLMTRPVLQLGDGLANLSHLPRKDRKKLRRLSREVAAYWGKREDAPDVELIQFLREEYTDLVAGSELLAPEEIDREILKSGFCVGPDGYSDKDTSYPGSARFDGDDEDLEGMDDEDKEIHRLLIKQEMDRERGTHLDTARIDPYDVQSSPLAQVHNLS